VKILVLPRRLRYNFHNAKKVADEPAAPFRSRLFPNDAATESARPS
jgi:hypothetical protein